MIDPRLLFQLSEIIKFGSLRRAAEHLNVTQPTLTRNIQILEDRAAGKVLRRMRQGVEATRLGQRLSHHGQEIASQCNSAEEVIEKWQMGINQDVVLGIGPMVAASVMRHFLAHQADQKLPYGIQTLTIPAERLGSRMELNDIDVAIATSSFERNLAGFHRTALFTDQPVIFVGPQNPLSRHKGIVDAVQLNDQNWISIGSSAIQANRRDTLRAMGVRNQKTSFQFSGDATIGLHMLMTTNSAAILPRYQTRMIPGSNVLTELKISIEFPEIELALWASTRSRDTPQILDFQKRLMLFIKGLLFEIE